MKFFDGYDVGINIVYFKVIIALL